MGCITSAANENDFCKADMVIVCLHPVATRSFMESYIPKLKSGCILFDVCGIKGQMVSDITELALKHSVHYVGTHPMAGKEFSGFNYSDKDLFNSANFIVTPIKDTDTENALNKVIKLAKEIGFGHIINTDPYEHDKIIAIPHNLHILFQVHMLKSYAGKRKRVHWWQLSGYDKNRHS